MDIKMTTDEFIKMFNDFFANKGSCIHQISDGVVSLSTNSLYLFNIDDPFHPTDRQVYLEIIDKLTECNGEHKTLRQCINNDYRITGIKIIKINTGWDLKESKDFFNRIVLKYHM